MDWANNNGMALNTSKTKAMAIGTRQRLGDKSLNMKVGETPICYSTCEKLLGVYVDSNMTWTKHVDALLKKLNGKLNLIKRIRHFLPLEHRLILYNTLIKSSLEYCCTVWGSCSKEDLDRLLKFQKHAARVILNADYTAFHYSQSPQMVTD